MEQSPRVILVTNDDGIAAAGLAALAEAMEALGEVCVVAPDRERSTVGHSLTLHRPLRVEQIGTRLFAVNGMPADCVNLGILGLLPVPPSLVVSGINHGGNLGDDVTYSGTVSAAMEGALAGIRSIALSQVYSKEGVGNAVSFDAAEQWGEKVLRPLVDTRFASRTLVNVNFPAVTGGEVRGIRVVRQGFHDYGRGSVVEGIDPRGFPYFWFGLHGIEHTPGADSDLEAISAGYVSVTPLHVDLTHEASLGMLAERYSA